MGESTLHGKAYKKYTKITCCVSVGNPQMKSVAMFTFGTLKIKTKLINFKKAFV